MIKALWSSHIMQFRQTSDFISCKKIQELKRSTIYFANGTTRYTSSETEGLKNEMTAAKKAMHGINRH
jgi:hypothetical protein